MKISEAKNDDDDDERMIITAPNGWMLTDRKFWTVARQDLVDLQADEHSFRNVYIIGGRSVYSSDTIQKLCFINILFELFGSKLSYIKKRRFISTSPLPLSTIDSND